MPSATRRRREVRRPAVRNAEPWTSRLGGSQLSTVGRLSLPAADCRLPPALGSLLQTGPEPFDAAQVIRFECLTRVGDAGIQARQLAHPVGQRRVLRRDPLGEFQRSLFGQSA